jgi:hypothetical protein
MGNGIYLCTLSCCSNNLFSLFLIHGISDHIGRVSIVMQLGWVSDISIVAESSATSSASIVDLVNIVYLRDLHEIAAPPKVNMYPLVALISSVSRSNLHHYTPLVHLGTQYSAVHTLWFLSSTSSLVLVQSSDHFLDFN